MKYKEQLERIIRDEIFVLAGQLAEFCLKHDSEEMLDYSSNYPPEEGEVMQWWLVSDWLAEKLIEEGEPMLNFMDCNNFWGRTGCQSALSTEPALMNIADRFSCNEDEE